ncbi:MAG: hypothetical protein KKI13_02050 [Candidatus Omnitrophica bacterium]|nr:hypothetical protein [Candidatus Omnitrophota bacterium]MCG2704616.1 hypothetical protein [Candidatus Omnitrophota bacterium]
MKNFEIATRRFAALAMTILVVLLFTSTSRAEFYRYNIDELARKAKVRIKEIEQKIWEEQAQDKLQGILSEIKPLYDEAESLLAEKRYEEAVTVYKKIDKLSRNPKITKWLKK